MPAFVPSAAGKRPATPVPVPVPVAKRAKVVEGADAPAVLVRGHPNGAWERENARDIREIEAYMDKQSAFVHTREQINNRCYAKSKFPAWRRKLGEALKEPKDYGYKSVLHMNRLSSDNALVSYKDLDDAAQVEAEVQLLGCCDGEDQEMRGKPMGFLTHSNYETKTFDYVRAHVAELVQHVPLRGGAYRSTPAQRLSEGVKGKCLPIDVKMAIRREWLHEEKARSARDFKTYCLALTAQEHVELLFNKDPTGCGKTSSTIKQAMAGIALDEAWAKTKRDCESQGRVGVRMENLGLREMPPPGASSEHGLSRVAIALVPEELMHQWELAAHAVSEVYQKEFGKGFHVWTGYGCITRKKGSTEGIKRVLSVAHELTGQTDQALFWILKADTHASKVALRDAPNLAVWYRIYDEMTSGRNTEPKNSWEAQSPCLHNVIVNATVQQLQHRTSHQPNHPLRLALRGQNLSLSCPKHAAIVTLCSSPAWLRRMAGSEVGIAPHMPQGIQKIALRVKVQTLAGAIRASEMLITTTKSLVEQLLSTVGCSGMDPAERRDFVQRCAAMLEHAKDGAPVATRLRNALESTQRDLAAVPEDLENLQQNLDHNRTMRRMRDAYKTMIRLFTRLVEAVCSDERPDCPITLEPIPIEFTCVLACCGGFIDSRQVGMLTRCCFCRKQLNAGVLRVAKAVQAMDGGDAASAPKAEAAPAPAPTGVAEGDAASLVAAYKAKAGLTCKSSLEAVTTGIRLALQWKPRGLRVLLCFNISNFSDNDSERTRETRRFIGGELPALTSVEAMLKGGSNLLKYKEDDDTNRVMLINTGHGSASVAGLDLGNTDLVLFDNMATRGGISAATVVQAIGRALRPQKCPEAQAQRNRAHYQATGASNWAPKLVLTINRYTEAAAVVASTA